MISYHKIILALSDILILVFSVTAGFWLVFQAGYFQEPHPFPNYYLPTLMLSSFILLVIFQLNGLYQYQAVTNAAHHVRLVFRSFFHLLLTFVTVAFLLKTQYLNDSRLIIGFGFTIGLVMSLMIRVGVIPYIYRRLVDRGLFRKSALIYGAGEHGSQVLERIRSNDFIYFDVCGFIDDDPSKIGGRILGVPIMGSGADLEDLLNMHRINLIIIAISSISHGKLQELIARCKTCQVITHVLSDLYSGVTEKLEVEEYGGLQTYRIVFRQPGLIRNAAKRMMDLLISSVMLLAAGPLMAAVAWLVKRDSPGPIFYHREVVGKDGKTFTMYKFRTMEYRNDQSQHLAFMEQFIRGKVINDFYLKDETRITKIGAVLRKYSLDELPQLWNVLKGEMSLVGPRFCSVEEYRFYKPWHKKRTAVKPGLTGIWQVRARSAVSYDDMVTLDIYYIENMSFWLDLELLLRTLPVVFSGKGSRVGASRGFQNISLKGNPNSINLPTCSRKASQ